MEKDRIDLISQDTYQTLMQLFSCLSNEQATLIDHMKDEILANISQYTRMTNFWRPVKKVEAIFLQKIVRQSQEDRIILKRALVAKLALELPALVEKMNLPTSTRTLYPDALKRLADFLKAADDESYGSDGDFFCKDVRFVLGLSIPAGSRLIDIKSRINLPSVILSAYRSRKIDGVIRYFGAGGTGIWLRGHVDSRYVYMAEFNEQEAVKFYLRVAELMELQKDIKGYVGTTWYLDPQLLEISPRLAYLQELPRAGGAFFLRHGTEQSDIDMAIKTSETRRRLYQEGKYIPVCYSVLWPRKELIAWAKQYRAFPPHD